MNRIARFYVIRPPNVWNWSRHNQTSLLLKVIYWTRTIYIKGNLLLLYSPTLGRLLTLSVSNGVGMCLTSELSAMPSDTTDNALQPEYMANISLKIGNDYWQPIDCHYYLHGDANDRENETSCVESYDQVTGAGNLVASRSQGANQDQNTAKRGGGEDLQCFRLFRGHLVEYDNKGEHNDNFKSEGWRLANRTCETVNCQNWTRDIAMANEVRQVAKEMTDAKEPKAVPGEVNKEERWQRQGNQGDTCGKHGYIGGKHRDYGGKHTMKVDLREGFIKRCQRLDKQEGQIGINQKPLVIVELN